MDQVEVSDEARQVLERVSRRFGNRLRPLTISQYLAFREEVKLDVAFTADRFLARGQYGETYSGTMEQEIPTLIVDSADGRTTTIRRILPVAIKLQKEPFNPPQITQEVILMTSLTHPQLVRVFHALGPVIQDGYYSPKQERGFDTIGIMIVMELLSGGTLHDYQYGRLESTGLGTHRERPMPECFCRNVADQLLIAVEYLHSNRVAHKDMHVSNCMFDLHGTVKLIDLGLAGVYMKDGGEFIDRADFVALDPFGSSSSPRQAAGRPAVGSGHSSVESSTGFIQTKSEDIWRPVEGQARLLADLTNLLGRIRSDVSDNSACHATTSADYQDSPSSSADTVNTITEMDPEIYERTFFRDLRNVGRTLCRFNFFDPDGITEGSDSTMVGFIYWCLHSDDIKARHPNKRDPLQELIHHRWLVEDDLRKLFISVR